ncbi:hypothetical protein DICVIV_00181 [Dictyocaulus viviparus]|uniref:Uncharacterized protein n=1 Tax=Dictyocaulus viviparus TaxID=29172 RepID=A0A0D8YC36_DICVI|nr:hypothetical protein DICVIV_00181 [Dictyocaulus viviparus]
MTSQFTKLFSFILANVHDPAVPDDGETGNNIDRRTHEYTEEDHQRSDQRRSFAVLSLTAEDWLDFREIGFDLLEVEGRRYDIDFKAETLWRSVEDEEVAYECKKKGMLNNNSYNKQEDEKKTTFKWLPMYYNCFLIFLLTSPTSHQVRSMEVTLRYPLRSSDVFIFRATSSLKRPHKRLGRMMTTQLALPARTFLIKIVKREKNVVETLRLPCYSCMSPYLEDHYPYISHLYRKPLSFDSHCDKNNLDRSYLFVKNCSDMCVTLRINDVVGELFLRCLKSDKSLALMTYQAYNWTKKLRMLEQNRMSKKALQRKLLGRVSSPQNGAKLFAMAASIIPHNLIWQKAKSLQSYTVEPHMINFVQNSYEDKIIDEVRLDLIEITVMLVILPP